MIEKRPGWVSHLRTVNYIQFGIMFILYIAIHCGSSGIWAEFYRLEEKRYYKYEEYSKRLNRLENGSMYHEYRLGDLEDNFYLNRRIIK